MTDDSGPPIDVIVDLLMPRDDVIERNVLPVIADFAVQRAEGADLAIRYAQLIAIEGTALAEVARPLLSEASAAERFAGIAAKFATLDAVGPVWVRQFVEGSTIMGGRTTDQWQTDAYGQVGAWLAAMGLK